MSASNSSPSNKTQTSTEVNTKNLNVSGNSGGTIVGGDNSSGPLVTTNTQNVSTFNTQSNSNNTTNNSTSNYLKDSNNTSSYSSTVNLSTDQGAVAGGISLGKSAIGAVSDVTQQSISASTGLTSQALDIVSATNQNASAFQESALKSTQDVLGMLSGQFVGAVSAFENNSQTTLANTVSALNQISKEQNQSADQLVVQASSDAQAQASDTLVKVFKYLAGAVAAGLVVWAITKGKAT